MNALGKVGAIAAAAVAVGSGLIYWAYKSYRKEQQQIIVEDQPQQQKEKEFDLEAEVAKLKLEIDSANPSFQDIKRIFGLLTRYIKSRTTSLTTELKAQRRRLFPKHSRFSRTAAYMRHTAVGLNRLQNTMAELQGQQAKVIASLGISQQKMAQFGAQLLPFIQEIMDTGLTLEQVQHHFRIKIEYLRANGEKLVQALELIMPELTADERQYIPIFMHTVISDQCFEGEPALDNDQFDIAAEKYSAQLGTEMMQLQQVIIPISQRLDAAMMALGEGAHKIPGYGDESTGMEMMMEKEQRMMEQLEAIRQHDPQAYEQLMAMMQSQMGR